MANVRQEKFIDKYIQLVVLGNGSAAEAYRQAGYKSKSPQVEACKLLKNPNIAAKIEARKNEIFAKEKVTEEKILRELSSVAFSNIQDYLVWNEHGKIRLKRTSKLSRPQAAAVASIKQTKEGLEFKFNDKISALELLGRNLKMFTDKVAVGGDADNPNVVTVKFETPDE